MDLTLINFDVLSGQAAAKMDDRREVVSVGDEPYVSLHAMGSEDYSTS